MLRFLTILVSAALLSACTHEVQLDPAVPNTGSAGDPPRIDRVVGLYISPEFRAASSDQGAYGDTWHFPIGRASAGAIERATGQVFRRVVAVGQLPSGDGRVTGIDAVLEPAIDSHVVNIPILKTGTHRAEVSYRFTLYDLAGNTVASWVVRGEGTSPGGFTFSYTKWPAEATNRAIENAMRTYVDTAAEEPEIRLWLNRTAPAVTG